MSTNCPQVVSLSDKQKSLGKSSPPKNICQPFTLRLVLGVPILKEESKIYSDMENMFAHHAQNDEFSASNPVVRTETDLFWSHIQTGLNTVVKLLEDAVRETTPAKSADPFSVVLLDFAWLNSQLGHHLAHICSGTPHTSLVAVNPPGKLAKMLNSQAKVVCVAIRPLMHPNTNRLPLLRDFLRTCASLAGKSLPPDPAAPTNTLVITGGVEGAIDAPPGALGSTPQYVPILPKPPAATMLVSPHPGVDITASSSGYVVAASAPSSNILANTLIGAPRSSLPRPQLPPKPVPRPAVRHIPADDWLTYRLDHNKLYKCGGDISKELENHSLYIHDVEDIWALYPRHLAVTSAVKPGPPEMGVGGSTGGGLRRKGGPMTPHSKGRSSGSHPPSSKQRRSHQVPPPPQSIDYFDEEDDFPEEGGMEDEEGEDDYELEDDYPGGPSYLSPSPPQTSSRHNRYSASSSSRHRGGSGAYQRKLPPEPSTTYGSGSRRRSRRSPRW
ncbi:unnamed protein product [Hymenolepis diminuta]|uniref:AAA domain-containing protein n=1 Tax=Hymenolepis diminuta TaxID=6216 RepID=A0A0R3S7W9_HYMDI|nr:unnamed protein product [Hymenolepis diminuta]VUZ42571.1 unnamed protein product [Hymenolepis diminuta]